MKTLSILYSFVLLLFAGCSTTYNVPRDPRAAEFVDARGDIEGRTVIVMPVVGDDFGCDSVKFQSDTLKGYDLNTQTPVKIPLTNVFEIVVTDVGRGARRGAVSGTAVGAVVGAIAGALAHVSIPYGNPNYHYSFEALGACTLLGALGGFGIGASAFSTYHYRFGPEGDYTSEREPKYIFEKDRPQLEGLSKIGREPTLEDLPPSEIIMLNAYPLYDETPEAISILWDRKPLWLPKSKIKVERLDGGLINLTVPKSLLEPAQEK